MDDLNVDGPKCTFMTRAAMMVVGIECRTSNDLGAASQDIPKHWERFYAENVFDRISFKKAHEIIALYCDYDKDATQPYSFVIGCSVEKVEELPAGLVVKQLPETTYAVFKAVGEFPESVSTLWQKIWKMNLLRTFSGDYEVYGEGFLKESAQEVDIYIAVEKG